MPSPGVKGARERAKKSEPGAGAGKKGMKGPWTTEPPKPGWALTQERLVAMLPKQRHRYLLFGDLLDDAGAAASIFPRESVEIPYCMPDPRMWTQAFEPPAERQNRLLGVLKAAEARGRVRALRLRYTRMRVCKGPTGSAPPSPAKEGPPCWREEADRGLPLDSSPGLLSKLGSQAEEIALLIQKQGSARAAIRLELFLPPQLKPTKIPDPLGRQEVRAKPKTGGSG